MIFFHLKNCLFRFFSPPRPAAPHAAGHAVHFFRLRCDFARNGGPPRFFFNTASAFFTVLLYRFCAFIQSLPLKRTEFPLHSVQNSRNFAPHFLFVQCPEARRFGACRGPRAPEFPGRFKPRRKTDGGRETRPPCFYFAVQISSQAICASFARSAAYSAMRVCAPRSASGSCPGTPKTG